MISRPFVYGGLEVKLFKSETHGWVTTTAELAKGVGYSDQQLRNLIKSKNLVHKESVIEDMELGKKICLTSKGGPKPTVFWTIEGMTFVAMFLNSDSCEMFRKEVLGTIKKLEAEGFVSSAEVLKKLETMQQMLLQQGAAIADNARAAADNARANAETARMVTNMSAMMLEQQRQLDAYRQADVHEASAAGKMLAAVKARKDHLKLVS